MSNLSPLEQAILRTLVYYDIHDYPLTPAEIWRWIWVNEDLRLKISDAKVEDVEEALRSLELHEQIERVGEYAALKGRAEIVSIRKQRLELDKKKWQRAKTVARYLEIVPFIRMVAVVNTLAINNAKAESDIDLLIVTSSNHIWISRMAVTGIVALLGYRRHKQKIADRVCLSFYITTDALNLEPLQRQVPDYHFMFWASQAVPLLDHGVYEQFVQQNNWITKHLPNAWTWDWKSQLVTPNKSFRSIKTTYEAFFNSPIGVMLEGWARSHQMKRFEKNIQSKSREGNTEVVISEDVLKFHEADRRMEYNQKFEERLRLLGLN